MASYRGRLSPLAASDGYWMSHGLISRLVIMRLFDDGLVGYRFDYKSMFVHSIWSNMMSRQGT